MPVHPAEEATLRAFVVPAKRDRLIALLGSAKRRKRALDTLNHFTGWDPRWAEPISSSTDVLAVLRKAGAPPNCHVISGDNGLDGRDAPLAEAVSAAERYWFASILCCVPGELAVFFDETAAPRTRVLLRRPRTAH
jgi:hypothetical protein